MVVNTTHIGHKSGEADYYLNLRGDCLRSVSQPLSSFMMHMWIIHDYRDKRG